MVFDLEGKLTVAIIYLLLENRKPVGTIEVRQELK